MIFLCGSRCLSFIKNPHDYDFSVDFYQEKDKIKRVKEILKLKYQKNVDLFGIINPFYSPGFISFIWYDKNINPYSKLDWDYLKYKKEIKQILIKDVNNNFIWRKNKDFYRYEILLLYLENNNFNPTPQEKDLINRLHDCLLTDREFYEYKQNLINRIKNIKV